MKRLQSTVVVEKFERRKSEIRSTAARLFRKFSFSGTSMDMIAAEMKVNKGTLYHYYNKKPDILYDIVISPVRELAQILDDTPPSDSIRDEIANIIKLAAKQTNAWDDEVAVYFQEIRYLPLWLTSDQLGTLRKFEARYTERLRYLLLQGQRTGMIIEGDPSAIRNALAGLTGSLFTWFNPDGHLSIDELADLFARIALEGLVVRDGGSDIASTVHD